MKTEIKTLLADKLSAATEDFSWQLLQERMKTSQGLKL